MPKPITAAPSCQEISPEGSGGAVAAATVALPDSRLGLQAAKLKHPKRPKPESRNPKPETPNPKSQVRTSCRLYATWQNRVNSVPLSQGLRGFGGLGFGGWWLGLSGLGL